MVQAAQSCAFTMAWREAPGQGCETKQARDLGGYISTSINVMHVQVMLHAYAESCIINETDLMALTQTKSMAVLESTRYEKTKNIP